MKETSLNKKRLAILKDGRWFSFKAKDLLIHTNNDYEHPFVDYNTLRRAQRFAAKFPNDLKPIIQYGSTPSVDIWWRKNKYE